VAPRYGGPSTNIWPLIRACNSLEALNCEVATTDLDGPNAPVDNSVIPHDVVCHVFEMVGRGRFANSPKLMDWLRQQAQHYDLFHFHGLWNRIITRAAHIARISGIPYIVRPAGMLSAYTWQRGPILKHLYWWLAERKTIMNASAIHVTSPEEADEAKACTTTVRIVEAPNGLEQSAFETPVQPLWLRNRIREAAGSLPIILFLSRLHPKKGITDILLPAFARLKTASFLAIAGGVDESTPQYSQQIDDAIERFGLSKRVARIGPIAPADRWAAFDGASVFCLPSENENFGTVVTESMARGCPVVVSDRVAAGRYAVEAGAGRMVPRTIEAIAKALDDELFRASSRIIRGNRAREYVRAHLSWESVAERLRKLYFEIIDQRLPKTHLRA
jgi:glycosyltransferase involved in cell wall biosynthesis